MGLTKEIFNPWGSRDKKGTKAGQHEEIGKFVELIHLFLFHNLVRVVRDLRNE